MPSTNVTDGAGRPPPRRLSRDLVPIPRSLCFSIMLYHESLRFPIMVYHEMDNFGDRSRVSGTNMTYGTGRTPPPSKAPPKPGA